MNNKLPKVRIICTYDEDGEQVIRVRLYNDLHDAVEYIAENYHQNCWEGYMTAFEVCDNDKVNATLAKFEKSGYEFIDEGIRQFFKNQKGYLHPKTRTLMLGEPIGTYPYKYNWSAMGAKEALKKYCGLFSKAVAIDLLNGKVYHKDPSY